MPDEPIVDEITEPDEPGETPPPVDVRPPWVDDIVEAITALPDAIVAQLPNPVGPDTGTLPTDDGKTDLPGDGEMIEDESPVSQPWTHKNPFKH